MRVLILQRDNTLRLPRANHLRHAPYIGMLVQRRKILRLTLLKFSFLPLQNTSR